MKVSNTSLNPIALPCGTLVPAGGAAEVKDFAQHASHPVVSGWLKDGTLSTDEPVAAPKVKAVKIKDAD